MSSNSFRLKAFALLLLFCVLFSCKQLEKPTEWTKSKVLATKLDHPSAMAVDDKNIYFVTGGTIASRNEGTNNIMRMPIEGGEPTVLFKGGDKYLPDTFVIKTDDKFVYWIDGGKLLRIPKEGGTFETVSDKFGMAVEVVFDSENFYSIDFGGENSPPAPIYSMKRNGGESKPFTNPRRGANGLCMDNEFIYWIESEGIYKIPKKGGEISRIYSPPNGQRTIGLKMDADNFYFTQGESKGALIKLSKKGGEPVQLAKSINFVFDFEIDESNVYFIDNGNYGDVDYYICKVSKNGGEVTKLDGGYLQKFTVGKTHIYFDDIVSIYSIPK